MASKSYDKIADICVQLMLQIAAMVLLLKTNGLMRFIFSVISMMKKKEEEEEEKKKEEEGEDGDEKEERRRRRENN
ncbi:hypothetical protein Dsin_017029 [Dipteronia sinensis]|uniref:Uncharacterized protein n=1 Tax=Dipteronia sinensis TaxID=43782 RepID=A0AAE0AF59_9ROSI|nr:hypothetical protein Dsin_017029 [Dipteronia sinensis]